MAAKVKPFMLSETQVQNIKRLRNQIKGTLEYLQKCDRCNFDVKAEIEKTQEQLTSLDNTLREFAPRNMQ